MQQTLERYFKTLNLPTASEIMRLAARIGLLGDKLDDILDQLKRLDGKPTRSPGKRPTGQPS